MRADIWDMLTATGAVLLSAAGYIVTPALGMASAGMFFLIFGLLGAARSRRLVAPAASRPHTPGQDGRGP